MTPSSQEVTRRGFFAKIALLFNGFVGAALAVPILRYLASPVTRRAQKREMTLGFRLVCWIKFPAGETRLATYRNPMVNAWDGETADIACWVRNVDGKKFQVFAINCAHLGCPVPLVPAIKPVLCAPVMAALTTRMAPAPPVLPSGGLFEYPHKVEGDKTADSRRRDAHTRTLRQQVERVFLMRLIGRVGEWFDQRLQFRQPIRERYAASGAAPDCELVVCFRQRGPDDFHLSSRDRHSSGSGIRALGGRSLEQPANSQSPDHAGMVHSRPCTVGAQISCWPS